jgi:hypothetical protein
MKMQIACGISGIDRWKIFFWWFVRRFLCRTTSKYCVKGSLFVDECKSWKQSSMGDLFNYIGFGKRGKSKPYLNLRSLGLEVFTGSSQSGKK